MRFGVPTHPEQFRVYSDDERNVARWRRVETPESPWMPGHRPWRGSLRRRRLEHIAWSGHICDIPFRKCPQAPVTYLENPELDALLAAPDRSTPQGRRDHAVLLFLYNTAARADEAAQLAVGDLELGDHGYASVRIRGKGNKIRHCPLWARTITELRALTRGRARTERVFSIAASTP